MTGEEYAELVDSIMRARRELDLAQLAAMRGWYDRELVLDALYRSAAHAKRAWEVAQR